MGVAVAADGVADVTADTGTRELPGPDATEPEDGTVADATTGIGTGKDAGADVGPDDDDDDAAAFGGAGVRAVPVESGIRSIANFVVVVVVVVVPGTRALASGETRVS